LKTKREKSPYFQPTLDVGEGHISRKGKKKLELKARPVVKIRDFGIK